MKRILKIAGIVVAILVVILIAIPFFINVNSFRPKIEATASEALGRQVKVGNLSLSILTGSVSADNISIAEDPAFGTTPFVTAKSLKVGVEVWPLITSKEIRVTDITLEQPQITLLKTADGKWNFSSLGGKSTEKSVPSNSGSSPGNLSVAKLSVTDGKLIVGKANSSAKPHAIEELLLLGLIVYAAYRIWLVRKNRVYRVVPRVQVQEIIEKLASEEADKVLLVDVRSHGYYDADTARIKGSIRIEPNNLEAELKKLPPDKDVYLYCT